MAMAFTMPETFSIVQGGEPATDAAGRTGDYVSLKHCHKMWCIWHITQGAANTVACSFSEATTVAGAGAQATTTTNGVWSNLTCGTTGVMTRRADAANYTTDAAVLHKIVCMQFDPSQFTATYDCIAGVTGASNVGNITSFVYYLWARYQQDAMPNPIVD